GIGGQRAERTLRRDRGAGDGGHRGGAGGAGPRRRDAGEIRGRLPDRAAPQLRRLRREPGTTMERAQAGWNPARAVKRPSVLVGLPGSGKTTVGRLAANLLSTAFTDIDETVVAA